MEILLTSYRNDDILFQFVAQCRRRVVRKRTVYIVFVQISFVSCFKEIQNPAKSMKIQTK